MIHQENNKIQRLNRFEQIYSADSFPGASQIPTTPCTLWKGGAQRQHEAWLYVVSGARSTNGGSTTSLRSSCVHHVATGIAGLHGP